MSTSILGLSFKKSTKKLIKAAISVQLIVAYLLVSVGVAQAADLPLPPVGMAAEAITDTSVTITWQAGGGSEDYFTLEQKSALDANFNSIGVKMVDGNENFSFSFTNLLPDTNYEFRLIAIDAENGVTVASSGKVVLAAKTQATPNASAPQGLQIINVGADSVTVGWLPGNGTENFYVLEKKSGLDAGFITATILEETGDDDYNYTYTNLLFNTDYEFRVVASHLAETGQTLDSAASSVVLATTLPDSGEEVDPTLPAAPILESVTNLTATAVTITWLAGGGSENVFIIEQKSALDPDFIPKSMSVIDGAGSYTFTFNNLLPATDYEMRINAVEMANDSTVIASANLIVPITTLATTASGAVAPVNLTVVDITANSITVEWEPGNGTENRFNISEKSSLDPDFVQKGSVFVDDSSLYTHTFANLISNTEYQLEVDAVEFAVGGEVIDSAAAVVTATTLADSSNDNGNNGSGNNPGNQGALNITGVFVVGVTDTSAIVIWDTDRESTSRVAYGTNSVGTPTETPNLGYNLSTSETTALVVGHSVTVTGLTPDTKYFVRPTSKNGQLTAVGAEVSFTTSGDSVSAPGGSGRTGGGGHFIVGGSGGSTGRVPSSPPSAGQVLGHKIGGGVRVPPESEGKVLGTKVSRLDELVADTKCGERSERVREMQLLLQEKGFFPSNITPTGYFGFITQGAVNDYIKSKTWTITQLVAIVRRGQTSLLVEMLQKDLKAKGFFPKDVLATGFFGPVTAEAVSKYKASVGISSGAVLGTKIVAVNVAALIADTKPGETSNKVRALQNELKMQGYFSLQSQSTGFYGVATERAVELYIRYNQFTLDELVVALSKGDKGQLVEIMQHQLRDKGYFPLEAEITGSYGNITAKAVADYQANK